MTAPAFLQLGSASDGDAAQVAAMLSQLSTCNLANREAMSYYDGSVTVKDLGISTPPKMKKLRTVAGWGGTVVDVLEERLDFLGWSSDEADALGLNDIYLRNALNVDAGMAHLDALICGLSFVTVGVGEDGEPSPLITPASPRNTTALWDRRTRRLTSALVVTSAGSPDMASIVTLYSPNATTVYEMSGGNWITLDRDDHKLGRPLVAVLPNRVRASRLLGRSEITRAVRYYTDAASRTLKGLEINREFYNTPQRLGLNMKPEDFEDENGNPVNQWSAIEGRMWMAPPNADGEPEPKVVQFSPSSPAPYLDQVKGYAQLLAAEAGIPAAYLGFQTDNPASADAIRAGEARLVKRAERRQAVFGRAWMEVARLALLVRDGVVPDDFETTVSTKWRDAATPTRAAAADEAVKLVGAGILPADSSITYDRIGLSVADQRQLAADKRRATGRNIIDKLTGLADGTDGNADNTDESESA